MTAPSSMDTLKAFHHACYGGDVATVSELVACDETLVSQPDKHGASGLHQAAFAGHADIVALLARGRVVDVVDVCGARVFECFFRLYRFVCACVCSLAPHNNIQREKCTPLHNAVFKCHEGRPRRGSKWPKCVLAHCLGKSVCRRADCRWS